MFMALELCMHLSRHMGKARLFTTMVAQSTGVYLIHSWEGVIIHWSSSEAQNKSAELEITATNGDNIIMGIRHRKFAVEGVQFHPESIMTDAGHAILNNFLKYTDGMWTDE